MTGEMRSKEEGGSRSTQNLHVSYWCWKTDFMRNRHKRHSPLKRRMKYRIEQNCNHDKWPRCCRSFPGATDDRCALKPLFACSHKRAYVRRGTRWLHVDDTGIKDSSLRLSIGGRNKRYRTVGESPRRITDDSPLVGWLVYSLTRMTDWMKKWFIGRLRSWREFFWYSVGHVRGHVTNHGWKSSQSSLRI